MGLLGWRQSRCRQTSAQLHPADPALTERFIIRGAEYIIKVAELDYS